MYLFCICWEENKQAQKIESLLFFILAWWASLGKKTCDAKHFYTLRESPAMVLE